MSNQEPLVSIITVSKNSALYIANALESVLYQNYDNYEYLIIDGASIDNTIKILRGYEPRFKGKMRWTSEPDTGIYNAINKGLKLASGEIIGILNSDDYYEKNILNDVVERIADHHMLHGRMRFVDHVGNSIKVYKHKKGCIRKFISTPFNHPTMFVKKEVYDGMGSFDESFPIAADYDFMLRFYKSVYRDYYFDRVITNLRTTGVTSSAQNVKNPDEIFKVLNKNGLPESLARFFVQCRYLRVGASKQLSKYPGLLNKVRKILPYHIDEE